MIHIQFLQPTELVIDGWLPSIQHCPSPNCNSRPDRAPISLLVIHNISLPPGQYGNSYIEDFFQNRLDSGIHPYFESIAGLQVSAHFLVKRNGEVIQFVSCDDRAWHAGQSCFQGQDNCNDYSIGIELEGCDDEVYEDVQYRQLGVLCHILMRAYPEIGRERITGHSDIAPNRKTDPGPAFDWQRLGKLIS